MINKFSLWVISTAAMWVILLIKTWEVPICWAFWRGFKWAPIEIIFSPSNIVAYTSILFLLITCRAIWIIKYKLKGAPISLPIKLNKIVDKRQYYVNSLATLVTLFAVLIVGYETYRDLLIFTAMLFVIYVCYTQTNLYYANPIMALLRYKVAEVETDVKCKELPSGSIILYKGEINSKIIPYHVSDNVYIVV